MEELRQQQEQLKQKQNQLQQEQERLQQLEQQATSRLDALKDNIQATAEQVSYNEEQLAIATQKLKVLQADLAIAEQQFQDQQFATIARLRFLQRQQGRYGWAVLLHSQNLNDFLDRRRQLKLVYESDRGILDDLQTKADDLEQRRQTVERQKNDIALLTQQLLAQKEEYETQAQEQAGLVTRLKQDQQALEAAESQLERDSRNITILIQQRIATAQGPVQGTGQMIFPVNAALTSGFGPRIHPILGYRRFHAGIDFGASTGTPIWAADSGRVIFAGWYGGYGRSVIINHGGGLTTLYAHTSQVYVTEGQMVQRGQAIAAVGSTGLSTGPHLHFEVRQNGNPVNPLGYL
ncbi:MAG: peptidoglycan DD-metalloendopeptidase family protein [Cyanothece sp. SIO2G6]|nr:peptidoglycan DD-metalloendopeptidase family protein [Cyanothece sp. SIO2G6]